MSLAAAWAQFVELRTKTLRSQIQIPIGRAQANLPNVGRQCRNHPVQVRSVFDPRTQPHRKRVSEIVHTRLVDRPIVASNAGKSTKSSKCPYQSALV